MIKRFLLWFWRVIPFPNFMRYIFLWMVNQKFLIGVGALIVDENGGILLFKHSYRKEYPWGLPGGWLKKGEDPVSAVEREIFEESGYRVRIMRPLLIDWSKQLPRIDIVFTGELVEEMDFVPSLEVEETQFFTVDDLPKVIQRQEEIIKDYFRYLDTITREKS